MSEEKQFAFQTPEFKWSEVILKGKKRYFVEGYISTIDRDDYGEVVTPEAQADMVRQITGKTITMDVEHSEWLDENGKVLPKPKSNQIPVAKIIDAKLKAKGTWVKAEINQNSTVFANVWNSIKENFLHSFSIGFYPLKAVKKELGGIVTKFIQKLNLTNVTLTGCPVNTHATFTPVMKAVLKNMEGQKMSEEQAQPAQAPAEEVKQEPKAEESPAEETKEEPKEENNAQPDLTKELDEANKLVEEQKKEIAEIKEKLDASEAAKVDAEAKAAEAAKATEDVKNPMSQIKSQIAENNKVIADLKAMLAAPVMKAKIEQDPLEKEKIVKAAQPEKQRAGTLKYI